MKPVGTDRPPHEALGPTSQDSKLPTPVPPSSVPGGILPRRLLHTELGALLMRRRGTAREAWARAGGGAQSLHPDEWSLICALLLPGPALAWPPLHSPFLSLLLPSSPLWLILSLRGSLFFSLHLPSLFPSGFSLPLSLALGLSSFDSSFISQGPSSREWCPLCPSSGLYHCGTPESDRLKVTSRLHPFLAVGLKVNLFTSQGLGVLICKWG